MVCSALAVGGEGLEDVDMDREDLCRRRVLFRVCCDLLFQAKVDLDQLVVTGVAVPHGCEYLPNGTKVLLHGPLIERDPSV